jgi:phage repressor protein C with HTH and peptisase S24 domain
MQDGKTTRSKGALFGDRFRELRTMLRLTQEQIAKQLGVTTATYNRYEKGHREPTAGLLVRMVKLAPGISSEWLLTGIGEPFGQDDANRDANLVQVAVLREPMTGDAQAPAQLEPNEVIAFSRRWVRHELKCDPESLALTEMAGDSMSPSILPGDLMLVRRDPESPVHDGIYVLRVGDAIQVRRLQWLSPDEVEVLPDNPLYKSRTMSPAELRQGRQVIGRVVWSGKRH